MQYSFSSISRWKLCPKQFYFHYILKLPQKYSFEVEKNLGSAVHDNIHLLFNGFDKTEEIYKKYLITEIDTANLYTQRGLDLLNKYAGYAIQTEYKFGLDKKLKGYLDFDDSKTLLRGYIDAILISEKECVIIDWKTGKNKGDKKQLEFYALVVSRLFNQKNIKGCFCYLKNMTVDWFEINEARILEIEKEIQEITNKIKADKTYKTKKGFYCRWCGFNHVCKPDEESDEPKNVVNLSHLKRTGVKL